MTRRDLIHKWSVYALGLLIIWVLDAYILPRYPLLGVSPMLLPPALAAVAVLEGAYAGTGFGLAVGLLWELAYPGGFGALVIFMALAGMATGGLSQYALSQSLPGCLLCSAGVLALLDGLRVARGLITNAAELPALLQVALPECLLSLAWTPLVYLLFRSIYRRVGGTKLA
ncbi:rod shape-determining protein MreD [Pseudoflavonifractor phocaeensis]|uniref:rod shape-determining protein MreD n=1 Tax=Pseudoflavonifractor phocaeensis TaxID=1870988 RepID=UPI001F3193EF|nr:rod shape-determining protein MreD [Pseudoflavonifractor phocaeensis]MCF2595780.1 rod shape-determining protein MreD [Pseudoflavonifractor phocaeensis]